MNKAHFQSQKRLLVNYPIVLSLLGTFIFSSCLPIKAQEIAISQKSAQLTALANKQQNKGKIRVAVLDFDFSTVSNPSFLNFLPGGGKGVSDILVNKLVQTGSFTVIERSKIDAVIAEQDLGGSGRVDASTAAQIGRLLGVETVIIGSITQFDLQERRSGFIVGSTTKKKAFVKLSARLVNTTTGEILTVADGNGEASQSDTQVFGAGTSSDNDSRLLTIATEQAVDGIIANINSDSAKLDSLPKATPNVNAVVADVSGSVIVLNKGGAAGYRQGMRLSVERVTKQVKDPQTGKVIRSITQPLGIIELTEVDSESSIGKIVSGSGFKVGDMAKPIQQ